MNSYVTFIDHTTGTIYLYDMGVLCNMKSVLCGMANALCDMSVLYDMSVLCNMDALCYTTFTLRQIYSDS